MAYNFIESAAQFEGSSNSPFLSVNVLKNGRIYFKAVKLSYLRHN